MFVEFVGLKSGSWCLKVFVGHLREIGIEKRPLMVDFKCLRKFL